MTTVKHGIMFTFTNINDKMFVNLDFEKKITVPGVGGVKLEHIKAVKEGIVELNGWLYESDSINCYGISKEIEYTFSGLETSGKIVFSIFEYNGVKPKVELMIAVEKALWAKRLKVINGEKETNLPPSSEEEFTEVTLFKLDLVETDLHYGKVFVNINPMESPNPSKLTLTKSDPFILNVHPQGAVSLGEQQTVVTLEPSQLSRQLTSISYIADASRVIVDANLLASMYGLFIEAKDGESWFIKADASLSRIERKV